MLCCKKSLARLLVCILAVFSASVYAAGATGIDDLLQNISGSFSGITSLLFALSTVAGLAFAGFSITKFKQHKDNPAQVTIGQPFFLFFIAVCLVYLPFILKSLGFTVTGATSDADLSSGQSTMMDPSQMKNKDTDKGAAKFLLHKDRSL